MKKKDHKWTEEDFQPRKKTSWVWEVLAVLVLYGIPFSIMYLCVKGLGFLLKYKF